MPKDPAYAGICKDPEIQPSVGRGGGGGGGLRSQGRAQGPAGNTVSPAWPASQPELSGSQGTSGGEEEGAGNHSLLQPALN